MSSTVKVLVTGAAGQIGYALLPHLVNGRAFGDGVRVDLALVEVPQVVERLQGSIMELQDCAFPGLNSATATSDMDEAAEGADWALLVGSVPRGIVYQGKKLEERSDLLKINGGIFVGQGAALGARAKPDCRVLVVGNPANTNCLIGQHAARKAGGDGQLWMAMLALDANRARHQLAARAGVGVEQVRRLAVWGNHSPTMVPDVDNALIGGQSARAAIGDDAWLDGEFLARVQQRGKAVIDARGASSAASAANAAIDTVRAVQGVTEDGDCFSAALACANDYGMPQDLICGMPLVSDGAGGVRPLPGFAVGEAARARIQVSLDELAAEREQVREHLG